MTQSTVVDRPALEDVAEEEDAFSAEGNSASGCCRVSVWRWLTFTSRQDFSFAFRGSEYRRCWGGGIWFLSMFFFFYGFSPGRTRSPVDISRICPAGFQEAGFLQVRYAETENTWNATRFFQTCLTWKRDCIWYVTVRWVTVEGSCLTWRVFHWKVYFEPTSCIIRKRFPGQEVRSNKNKKKTKLKTYIKSSVSTPNELGLTLLGMFSNTNTNIHPIDALLARFWVGKYEHLLLCIQW